MKELNACPCSGGTMPRYIQPVLLALLAQKSMYGYELMQQLTSLDIYAGNAPDIAGIYRKLREMESHGVLVTLAEESEIGPQRKRYTITDRGLECLERWEATLAKARTHLDAVLHLVQDTHAFCTPVSGSGEKAADPAQKAVPDGLDALGAMVRPCCCSQAQAAAKPGSSAGTKTGAKTRTKAGAGAKGTKGTKSTKSTKSK